MIGATPPADGAGSPQGTMRRVEDASIDASAPAEQRVVDGWLVRYANERAKRARSVQAIAAGVLPLADKVPIVEAIVARAGLPFYVRVTPFSQPPELDAYLESAGFARVDDSIVMIVPTLDSFATNSTVVPARLRIAAIDRDAFVAWIGRQRGASDAEQSAHRRRLSHSAAAYRALAIVDTNGDIVAGGQSARSDEFVGLYDVMTASALRGRGLGSLLCRHLLAAESSDGAAIGYLQVAADNVIARTMYRKLGFADAYRYHYRTRNA